MRNEKGQFVKGNRASKNTEFKKGSIPWNKGIKLPQFFGENSFHWKGGRVNNKGYTRIYSPNHPYRSADKYVLEHRLVVESQIGRYLTRKEVVHHIGEKDDNQPHMLMGFSSTPTHLCFHRNPKSVKKSDIIFDGRKLKN